jgi:hypothetical protein
MRTIIDTHDSNEDCISREELILSDDNYNDEVDAIAASRGMSVGYCDFCGPDLLVVALSPRHV